MDKKILKRIEELKKLRDERICATGRNKYNFAIGELQNLLMEAEN